MTPPLGKRLAGKDPCSVAVQAVLSHGSVHPRPLFASRASLPASVHAAGHVGEAEVCQSWFLIGWMWTPFLDYELWGAGRRQGHRYVSPPHPPGSFHYNRGDDGLPEGEHVQRRSWWGETPAAQLAYTAGGVSNPGRGEQGRA